MNQHHKLIETVSRNGGPARFTITYHARNRSLCVASDCILPECSGFACAKKPAFTGEPYTALRPDPSAGLRRKAVIADSVCTRKSGA